MRNWDATAARRPAYGELDHAAQLRSPASIAAAIANGPQARQILDLAPDTWYASKTITISQSNVTLRGRGGATRIQLQRGVNAALLVVTGDDVTIEGIAFLTESGTGATPEYAISVTGNNCTIRNCTFDGFYRTITATDNLRMMVTGNRFKSQSTSPVIDMNNTDYSVISGNIIETNATGNEIDLDAASLGNVVVGNIAVSGALYMPSATAHAANSPAATTF